MAKLKNDPVNPKHYTDMAISPIEYIDKNNIDYLEGNVIKYVSRYQMKNGIEDLKKARWYINFLINKLGEDNG